MKIKISRKVLLAMNIFTSRDNTRLGKDEWRAIAQDYCDATGDAEGASSISDMGVVPSVHAIGMFVGLQMAIAQLKSKP